MKFQNSIWETETSSLSPPPLQDEAQLDYVAKGPRHNQNQSEQFRQDLVELEQYKDVKIKELAPEIRIKFNNLKSSLALLHNSPLYDDVYTMVRSIFKCEVFNPENSEPGTVLAYFCGCYNSTRNKDNCSLYCANAMPRPKRQGGGECNENIVTAMNRGQILVFEFLTRNEQSNRATIYIQYLKLDNFPGFSYSELENLRNRGITEVKLAGFPQRGKASFISDRYIGIEQLPRRTEVVTGGSDDDGQLNDPNITILVFVIFVVIIIALFYLLYKYGKSHRN